MNWFFFFYWLYVAIQRSVSAIVVNIRFPLSSMSCAVFLSNRDFRWKFTWGYYCVGNAYSETYIYECMYIYIYVYVYINLNLLMFEAGLLVFFINKLGINLSQMILVETLSAWMVVPVRRYPTQILFASVPVVSLGGSAKKVSIWIEIYNAGLCVVMS